MSDIEVLKEKVEQQQLTIDALVRTLWHMRGEMKGEVGKMEKELEPHFKEWLERSKNDKQA